MLKAVKEKLKIFIIENTELNKLNIHHHIYKIKMNTENAKHPSKHYKGKGLIIHLMTRESCY